MIVWRRLFLSKKKISKGQNLPVLHRKKIAKMSNSGSSLGASGALVARTRLGRAKKIGHEAGDPNTPWANFIFAKIAKIFVKLFFTNFVKNLKFFFFYKKNDQF